MLTRNANAVVIRKDRPLLLFVLAIIWVCGTVFFHSPWEPFEPFVFSIIKSMIEHNSWFIPYISNNPYLEIQPFYFWLYAVIIKLFNINNIEYIANTVRIINTLLIFIILLIMGRIGSNLLAFKNGRTVILLLISNIGFINSTYQLSPNILILLGCCLFCYALQQYQKLPGISSWLLFLGLLLLSINSNCEFIILALLILLLLPIIDNYWRTTKYLFTISVGIILFSILFYLYIQQLQTIDHEIFIQWQLRYFNLLDHHHYNFFTHTLETIKFLLWYTIPCLPLAIWSIYKQKTRIFKDKVLVIAIIFSILLFLFTTISGKYVENTIFPIIIMLSLIASVEIDSIRITIVSLLNWFSIIVFGFLGIIIWTIYLFLNLPFNNSIIDYIISFTQNYKYHFSLWQLSLAIIISIIWLFMITRRHIRGREMITNWASGTTCIIILFLSLWLPLFDSIITFKSIVNNSLKYLDKNSCVSTNSFNGVQIPLWYYYANINLLPSFILIDFSLCNQAIIATDNINTIDKARWRILWAGKRPIDAVSYYVIKPR